MPTVSVKKRFSLSGHKDCIYTLEHGPEAGSFFSGGADGQLAQWHIDEPGQGRLLAKTSSTIYALKYLPEEKILVMGQNFDGIRLIDVQSRKDRGSLHLGNTAVFSIQAHDGKLFIGSGDGKLSVVALEDRMRLIHQQQHSEKSLRSLQLFAQQNEIVAGFSDHTIKIFNLKDYKLKQEIQAHKNSVFSLTFSPDFEYLLSGSRDAHLKIWHSRQGYQNASSIVAHMYTINHIAFSPSGRYFATCSKDKSIKLWDAREFRLLKVIDKARHAGHGTSVNKLLWVEENVLVSASDDRSISVWDIEITA